MALTTTTYVLGSATTLLSTELNSMASSSSTFVVSTVGGTSGLFSNTYGGGGLGGYTLGQFELKLAAPGGTLTASPVLFWFLQSVDGTNYEDGSTSVLPARQPDLIIPVRAVSTAQRIGGIYAPLPVGNWYVLIEQQTGQTWGSTLNTLKVTPVAYQNG
jgi:hypothetical protein